MAAAGAEAMSSIFENSFAAQRYTLHQSKEFDVTRPALFSTNEKRSPVRIFLVTLLRQRSLEF